MSEEEKKQPLENFNDPNREETEEDAIRAESIRRMKVLQLFQGRREQMPSSPGTQSNRTGESDSYTDEQQNQ